MLVRLCAVACLWLCVGAGVGVDVHVHARSTVTITSPASVKNSDPKLGTAIDHRPAVFGNPPYGSSLSGKLWYAKDTDPDSQLGCKPINIDADWPSGPLGSDHVIVMLNRSTAPGQKCSFVTKVRNAWLVGATSVVIINYNDIDMPFMADDGTGKTLVTTAVLITHTVGNLLINAMRPATRPFMKIAMQIGYELPSVNGAVSWQLWTTAYDSGSTSFKSVFGPADALLHMDTSFEPKYYFIRGKNMAEQCDQNPTNEVCQLSCVNEGQYCVTDPDNDGWLTGSNVVEENVWQMCLWQRLNETASGDPNDMQKHLRKNKWWSYVSTSERECDTSEELQGFECRQRVLDMTGLVPDSSWYTPIKACYDKCLVDNTGLCPIIEAVLDERDEQGIFYLPTLVINQEAVRGALSCNRPLETRSCQVLADICQGYNSTFRGNVSVCVAPWTGCDFGAPKDCGGQCQLSSGGFVNGLDACGLCLTVGDKAWNKTCIDCNGQVNGLSTLDKCGQCLLPTDPKRDKACLDCNDVIWGNATKDCAGDCGGGAKFDECGTCIRVDQRSSWNQSCTDCLGVFHGSAKLDVCGVCNGDGKSCASTVTVTSGSTNWGAVIAIVLAVAGVVGGAIYLYMKRQQNRMREDIDGILKQYLPLQDNTGGGGGGAGHIRPTQRLSGNDNL